MRPLWHGLEGVTVVNLDKKRRSGLRAFRCMVWGKLYIVFAQKAGKARHMVVKALLDVGYAYSYCDVEITRAYTYDHFLGHLML